MSKEVNKIVIGGFVIGGIGLAVLAVLVFGSGKFFQKKSTHVLFFEGSVKGLNVGSPVKLRGVDIGMVKDIQLTINSDELEFFVPVYVEIFGDRISVLEEEKVGQFKKHETVDILVNEMGMRAQLQMQSLLTGQLFINYDFYPETPIRKIGLEKKIYEVPTIPTTLQMLTETLEQIVNDIRKVNFQGIVENISKTFQGANEMMNSSDLRESAANLNIALQDMQKFIKKADVLAGNANSRVDSIADSFESTMDDTRKLMNNIDSRVEPVASDMENALAVVQSSFEKAETLLVEAQKMISENSNLRREIMMTLESMSDASRSMEELTDYLQQHPEALIRGK
ncbi:MAG: MlaD family protein [Desulfobacterales bacterium]|jgi:paraquat-inducible protein B|nr:MlaD family protein [Desulfobacterales bacterium]